jgi:hypothetical protein
MAWTAREADTSFGTILSEESEKTNAAYFSAIQFIVFDLTVEGSPISRSFTELPSHSRFCTK